MIDITPGYWWAKFENHEDEVVKLSKSGGKIIIDEYDGTFVMERSLAGYTLLERIPSAMEIRQMQADLAACEGEMESRAHLLAEQMYAQWIADSTQRSRS